VGTNTPWWISVVYGPQSDDAKIAFLQELREIRDDCQGPWMICGDFNLIHKAGDKNNGNLNRRMMGKFRRLLNDLALKEVYLNGRWYTWSNEQSPLTLVHLDRVLYTSDWGEEHGECHFRCLSSVVSDHSPLLLDCNPMAPTRRRFHFEEFWLRLDGFHETVAQA
jgi:endonuclease/exonuclease/phosphatase family metal-dependent hydrolase